jgi:hypothetical protein
LRTLKPDFKTIADFRADNRAAFKSVFRQFTLLCKRLDLFGRELLAIDGTRIKAVNNKDRNFTRNSLGKFIKQADERLADYLQRLDEGDAAEKATGGARVKNLAEKIEALSEKRGRYDAMLRQLERTGEDQISLTDPDSRAMAAYTKVAVGYNVQISVDAKHKLIVDEEVTNQVIDMGLLQATAEPAREILEVDRIDVVADAGYFRTEDIEACEQAGLTPHVPRPQRLASCAKWRKSITPTKRRATIARCAGAVRTPAIAPFRAWSTKMRWIEWRLAWKRGLKFFAVVARRSSIPLAQSSNG